MEGEIFRRSHQPSIKGKREATTGVLGTIPEIGAIKKVISKINFLGVLIFSEDISSLTPVSYTHLTLPTIYSV